MTDTAGREGVPSPTLQVIGAGFGRTGTASMRDAQVRLGFGPCDHMAENFEHQERFALWDAARQRKHAGEPINWLPLLTGFPAIVDWPGGVLLGRADRGAFGSQSHSYRARSEVLVRQHQRHDLYLAGRPAARAIGSIARTPLLNTIKR
jgi:hypothetical protein